MSRIKLIDNRRVHLADVLKDNVKKHEYLSIATGYWDLKGTTEVIDELSNYKNIRLLIGQEPLNSRGLSYRNLKDAKPDHDFPKNDFISDLEFDATNKESDKLRYTAYKLINMLESGQLEVKLYRKQRLHAKAYIFGNFEDPNAIGIVGSSNFTYAGLVNSAELNTFEDELQMVLYSPPSGLMPHGHLSWFNELWDDSDTEVWNGDFKELIENSPLGNLTYGPYEVYIKTLMELYPEELETPKELSDITVDVLYSFQNRNASLLISKLEQMSVAILADSVGLGKTITAGAVIKHYLETKRENIQVIAPAGLKQQWKDDLAKVLGIDYYDGSFRIVSQQDINAIRSIKEDYDKNWRRHKKIDLFVIDEAHNLRSSSGSRRDAILELLQQHPDSHILLLTATPINNTLMDIANQIQLASKGRLFSFNVPYQRPNSRNIEIIDFFDALKRIQSYIKKEEKNGRVVEYDLFKKTIHAGLRHYLVRSTRQGVEAESAMKKGEKIKFPESIVESINYKHGTKVNELTSTVIEYNIDSIFEGINPKMLNINIMSEFTQQTRHPLDIIEYVGHDTDLMLKTFDIDTKSIENTNLKLDKPVIGMVNNILQVIYLLGFPVYRPEIYRRKYYGASVESLRSMQRNNKIGIQLTIHNILHVTWLKRLESSTYALQKSVENYQKRLELFTKYLDKGYIVSLEDANLLEREYGQGDDLNQAFDDYEDYLTKERETIGTEDEGTLKKQGVKRQKADDKEFFINQLRKDIIRDTQITDILIDILKKVNKVENNSKLNAFKDYIINLMKEKKYGDKILVFSFFADTIEFLEKNLNGLVNAELINFKKESAFLSGKSTSVGNVVNRFSPVSKGYVIKTTENELNYLFATDILSEGQNLQDSGILINYDLHWNPVRMIQRNGRINRLGSNFEEVLIANMKPSDDIDLYLKLVTRLESKINVIKNTVGLDQGVLNISDVNPIQFIEQYYKDGSLPQEDDLLAYTDNHILNLRTFLSINKDDEEYIQKVKSIPFGKWNYLPNISTRDNVLSLVEVESNTSITNKTIKDLYFIDIETVKPYKAGYLEHHEALELIRTDEKDNSRRRDNIDLDRNSIISRSFGAAKRYAKNPTKNYKIDNQYQKALIYLQPHFPPTFDFKNLLENGIKEVKTKQDMEKVLRKVNKEMKDSNSIKVATLTKFTQLINRIKEELVVEDKIIDRINGVLYYV